MSRSQEKIQAVTIESDIRIEVRSVVAAVTLMNEVQSFQTEAVGADEVQKITTFADEVIAEVQTGSTSAIDINEIQTLHLLSDNLPEIHFFETNIFILSGHLNT
jgi:hypothetical protein